MDNNINYNEISIEKIKESDRNDINELSYSYVPQQYMIIDSRLLSEFKKNTLGGYPKSKVNQMLEKCLHSNQIEHACFLSFQLLTSGAINQSWDKLFSFIYKNINVCNPQIPFWLHKKELLFRKLISNKLFTKNAILETRNIQIFRNLITELVIICCISKKRKIETLKAKITDVDFIITNFHKKMRSKDNMLIRNLFGEEDPKEIQYAGNEFAYHLINKNMQDSLYWLQWILFWEKSMIKKYGSFSVSIRNIEGIEGSHQTDCIWLIWSIFHNLRFKIIENIKVNNNIGYTTNQKKNKKHITLLEKQLDELWKLYLHNWKPGNKNKKLSYLIWSIHLLINPVDWDIKLIEKMDIFIKAVSNVNLMFEKIKKQCVVMKYNNLSNLNNNYQTFGNLQPYSNNYQTVNNFQSSNNRNNSNNSNNSINRNNSINSNNSNNIQSNLLNKDYSNHKINKIVNSNNKSNTLSSNNSDNQNILNTNILNMGNTNQIINNLDNDINTNGINVIIKNNFKPTEKKQEEMLKKRQNKKESMEKNKNENLDLYKNKLDIVAQLDQYLNN